MFSVVRTPASRTSSQYVCYACRSQQITRSQRWRTLSTESQTAPQAQAVPTPPPNPEPAENFPGAEPHILPNDVTDAGGKIKYVRPSRSSKKSASPPPEGSESKRSTRKRRMKSLKVPTFEIEEQTAKITGNSFEPSASTGDDEAKAKLTTSDKNPAQNDKLARTWKKKMRKANVPAPSYKTVKDAGVVKAWQAEVAFDGEKFKVEATNKKLVTAKIQKMLMEHVSSMATRTKSAAGKAFVKSESERSPRARPRTVISKPRTRRVKTTTSKEMTLKEALTGRRRVPGARKAAQSNIAANIVLPDRIGKFCKPADEVVTVNASSLQVVPLHVPQSPVPPLSFGLDRVLFNPGVYRLRDPRSRVYNFDPYLERIVPAEEFDFAALKGYKVASSDPTLSNIAAENGIKYFTSTSSLTSVLMTFHFLISQWRPIDISTLSKAFEGPAETNFTTFTKAPTSIILKPKNGGYAIDKDEDGVGNTVLSLVGRSLEKLLTVPRKEFDKYRRSKVTGKSAIESPDTEEAFHYTGIGNLLVRSQLDGYDPRLPGSGIFDIKTRAVLPVRMDIRGRMEVASSYEIKDDHGNFQSFEREYHDMLRAPMLKYSMQARLGRMDGIFVAYHNITRMFGFQYVSLPEIDRAIHGSTDTFRGDQELRASINILQDVLDRASTKYPDQPLRMMFETRPGDEPFMHVFVEPVTFEYLEARAVEKQRRINEFESAVIYPDGDPTGASSATSADQLWTEDDKQGQQELDFDENIKLDSFDSLSKALSARQAKAGSGTKSAIQRLRELLSGEAAKQAKEADATARLAQAQELAVNIIREVSKFREADITDARRTTRKGELTKLKKATAKLEGWLDDLDPTDTPGVSITDHDDQIARLRDVVKRTLEEHQSLKFSHHDGSEALLALVLTVRNKVNGRYVSGPPDVDREDEWDVEYSIQEMEDNSKAWEHYDACVARRDKASVASTDDPEGDEKWYSSSFMRELATWSNRGAKWRLEQDEIDRNMGTTVFEPIDKSVIELGDMDSDKGVKEDERKGAVEEYMTWLFSGKGGDGKKE